MEKPSIVKSRIDCGRSLLHNRGDPTAGEARRDTIADSLRPETLEEPEGSSVERDAKTEDLLLAGLDRYFAGDYHQAIHIWTRVLFLDRGHTRARAYIERARSALAEQQRESEELLHSGVAALDRGEIDLARHLLTSSVDRGGPQELALPILARLNRLEAAVSAVESAQHPAAARLAAGNAPTPTPVRSNRWRLPVIVTCAAALGAVTFLLGGDLDWPGFSEGASSSAVGPTQPREEALPLAQPGEIALKRARRLFSTGHPVDALRSLDSIRSTDPIRGDADRLRADIQRALLRFIVPPPPDSGR